MTSELQAVGASMRRVRLIEPPSQPNVGLGKTGGSGRGLGVKSGDGLIGAKSTASVSGRSAFADLLGELASRTSALTGAFNTSRPIGQRSPSLLSSADIAGVLESQPFDLEDNLRTAGNIPFADLITSAARRHRISPELVAAVIKAESGFDPMAQSLAGAKGLMQLMDGTASLLGVKDALDPAQNIEGGVKFLSSLLKRYAGDVRLALAAYNAGPGAVEQYGGIPPYEETRRYVSRVLNYWDQFSRTSVLS